MTWKLTACAPRAAIEAALLAHEDAADWDPAIVLAGSELAADRPETWRLEAWLPRPPGAADRAAVAALFGGAAPAFTVEQLPETDWVTASQQGLEPIRAGRFRVRTPEHPQSNEPGVIELVVPASRAFGTGQHATTAGCLEMLSAIRARGAVIRNLADIGAGTGLLALAALRLWPRASAVAADIDPVCAPLIADNARANRAPLGGGPGALAVTVAAGLDHPLLQARAPYDLVVANILAGPLIALLPAFARGVLPGGQLLLAGLLASQEAAVRRAARRHGFRLAARLQRGDWTILWLRRRVTAGAEPARPRPARARPRGGRE